MKKSLGVFVAVAVFLTWSFVLFSNVAAQEKKGLRFITFDATAAGQPICLGSDAKTLTSCASTTGITQSQVTGLKTTDTPTFAGANLTTPLAVASGGTGTNSLFATSIASTPSFTGQLAITGGAAYIATSATVSTDWKQVSN